MDSSEPKKPRSRRSVNMIGFFGAIVLAIVVTVLLVVTRSDLVPAEPVERVWNIETQIVERRDHQPLMRVFGELAAGRSGEMRARVQGEIAAVGDDCRNGAVVSKGTVLIEIDRFE